MSRKLALVITAVAVTFAAGPAHAQSDDHDPYTHGLGGEVKGGGYLIPNGYMLGGGAEYYNGFYAFTAGVGRLSYAYTESDYSEDGSAFLVDLGGRIYFNHSSRGPWIDGRFLAGSRQMNYTETIAPGQVDTGSESGGVFGGSVGFGWKIAAGPLTIDPHVMAGGLTTGGFVVAGVFVGYRFGPSEKLRVARRKLRNYKSVAKKKKLVPKVKQPWEQAWDAGSNFAKANQAKEAAAEFKRVTELRPSYGPGHTMYGAMLSEMAQLKKALASMNKGLELMPKPNSFRFMGLYVRGTNYGRMNRMDDALVDFTESLALKSTSLAHSGRGAVYLQKRRPKKALADYDAALRLGGSETTADVYSGKGVAHMMLGEKAKGCEAFRTACAKGDCRLIQEYRECK